jgi:hypothetical protein
LQAGDTSIAQATLHSVPKSNGTASEALRRYFLMNAKRYRSTRKRLKMDKQIHSKHRSDVFQKPFAAVIDWAQPVQRKYWCGRPSECRDHGVAIKAVNIPA